MALDFMHGTVRPAFETHIEDRIYGAPVDYCYEDFSPVADSFNVPNLPAWANVLACYTFESSSRPGLFHVAVTFCGMDSLPEKALTFCGCDAAQHERLCWHVTTVEAFEDAAADMAVDEGPLDFDESYLAPFKVGDAVAYTSPVNGAYLEGSVRWARNGKASVNYWNPRLQKWETNTFNVAHLTPAPASVTRTGSSKAAAAKAFAELYGSEAA